jgi:hypothetical protein
MGNVMHEDDWSALTYSIRQNNCILVLGPDLVTEKVKGKDVPLAKILSNTLAEKLEDKDQLLDADNLMQAAQRYRNQKGRNALQAQVVSFYESRKNKPSCELLKDLAALPFYLVLYSTPDEFMTEAFQSLKKKSVRDWYNYNRARKASAKIGSPEEPLIFHLYGSIQEPDSMVLSENGLLDFLVKVISKNPALPDYIRGEFSDREKCFLFLGFGFHNWYLRVMMHVLFGSERDSSSFALEQLDTPAPADFGQTIFFFKERYKINIYEDNLYQFVKELKKRYEAFTANSKKGEETSELAPDASVVFLCHTSDNKDYAANLNKYLESEGLKPWLDKKKIYGGDEWDSLLEKTILKEVDYFVVLQSNAMEKKFESYFRKEIKLALERQQKFMPGIRFIIPTKIDDCQLLEELEHLQTIDLGIADNEKELARIIKRDHQRRKRE